MRSRVRLVHAQSKRLPFPDGRKAEDDDLLIGRDRLAARVDALHLQLGAREDLRLHRLAGIENPAGRIRHVAPGADHVEVLVDAFARLGVVVIQAEGVRVGLLQGIDDVAVADLARALGQAGALGRTLRRRRLPAASCRQRARLRRVAALSPGPGFHDERRLARRLVHEADANPAVRLREDL